VWEGVFEKKHSFWLRWLDHQGNLIPTGRELAELERKRADNERKHAELERKRADNERKCAELERIRAEQAEKQIMSERRLAEHEKQRADRLAEKLRELGIHFE